MRRWTSALAAVALAMVLSGCWVLPRADPGRGNANLGETALTSANVDQLEQLWATPLGQAQSSGINAPVSIGGRIFVSSTDDDVAALDARTGAVVWARQLSVLGFTTELRAPAHVSGQVLVPYGIQPPRNGTFGGGLFRLNPGSGATIATGEGAVRAELTVADDVPAMVTYQYFRDEDAHRSITWKYTPWLPAVVPGPQPGPSYAIVGDRILWSSGSDALGYSPACPTVPGNPQCGPDWSTDLGGLPAGPAKVGADGVVYVDDSGTVTVLDVATGAVRWSAEVGGTGGTGGPGGAGSTAPPLPPAVAGDTILVATTDGRLVALPAHGCGAPTCTGRWEAALGGPPVQAPAVGGDVVYATTRSSILAFPLDGCGAATCAPLVTVDAGQPITGGPVIDDGRVVVGTQSGRVVAFGSPG